MIIMDTLFYPLPKESDKGTWMTWSRRVGIGNRGRHIEGSCGGHARTDVRLCGWWRWRVEGVFLPTTRKVKIALTDKSLCDTCSMMLPLVVFTFSVGAASLLNVQHGLLEQKSMTTTIRSFSLLSIPTVPTRKHTVELRMVDSSDDFSSEEKSLVEKLYDKLQTTTDVNEVLLEDLPSLPPALILKLRQPVEHANEAISFVSTKMASFLDSQLQEAKLTLQELLDAGEIRKLDSLIGKAARSGKLNAAFFNVLSVNLQDATASVSLKEDGTPEDGDGDGSANRMNILQHVYTRCQEEVEKSIPPGLALLNKLIRQPQASIRKNLYEYYLTPQSNQITTPDGKQLELKGESPPLVSLDEFISAIAQTVRQIRTAERAGASDRVSSAAMVESCRQIAKEARIVIAERYGVESDEIASFQSGLQPVFRPSSADSPYITGETTS